MEPTDYLRLLRRRWLFLVLIAALGANIGYASTLISNDDPGPVVNHWSAGEVLVINPDAEAIDLQRVSVFATGGVVPERVAQARAVPVDEIIPRLRTVSDRGAGTLTIAAVGNQDPGEARDLAEEVTLGLLAELSAESEAAYGDLLVAAEQLVQDRLADVTDLDGQISVLNALASAAAVAAANEAEEGGVLDGGLSLEQQDQLRTLTVQRDAALTRFSDSEEALDTLQRTGPAPPSLSRLETVVPFRISQREYNTRLARGEQGETNFVAGQVDLADTSSPTVSERLEGPATRAALGALAGLIVGIAGVMIHMRLDPRLRSRDQIEVAFQLPALTEIPNFGRKDRADGLLHSRNRPRSAVAEAYRYLRSVLLFARQGMTTEAAEAVGTDAAPATRTGASEADHTRAGREVRVLMVTSAGEGEGKTTTAANLAVLMAEAGYDTLLVNCDFRLPSLHKVFGVEYAPGTVVDAGIENLRLVTDVQRTEGDTPGQVSERQRRLLRRAREQADLVILDTAPVLATNDAIDILPETDLVVLVARESKTTTDAANDARELLIDRMGVPVAGVVVTAVGSGLGSGYYEKYRYGSYYGREEANLFNVGKNALRGRRGKNKSPEVAPAPTRDTDEVVDVDFDPALAPPPPTRADAFTHAPPSVVKPQVVAPQIVEPQVVEPQVVEPQVVAPQIVEPQVVEPQVVAPVSLVEVETPVQQPEIIPQVERTVDEPADKPARRVKRPAPPGNTAESDGAAPDSPNEAVSEPVAASASSGSVPESGPQASEPIEASATSLAQALTPSVPEIAGAQAELDELFGAGAAAEAHPRHAVGDPSAPNGSASPTGSDEEPGAHINGIPKHGEVDLRHEDLLAALKGEPEVEVTE